MWCDGDRQSAQPTSACGSTRIGGSAKITGPEPGADEREEAGHDHLLSSSDVSKASRFAVHVAVAATQEPAKRLALRQ
jgi:hypothetical protein